MWYVSDHCRFVKGAVQAALYDLKEGKVYSLNKTGRDLLEMGLLDPSSLSDTGRQMCIRDRCGDQASVK